MINRVKKYIATLLVSTLITLPLIAGQLEDLTSLMQNKVNIIVAILKDKSLQKELQNKKIYKSVDGLFDYTLMSRLSVGKRNWLKLDSSQKQEFVKLFSTLMKESYAQKAHLLSDEKVTVNDAKQIKASRIYVPVNIEGSKETTQMLYKFYYSKKAIWLVYDVDIAGVSILQTYRAQFAEILKNSDMSELIEKLRSSISA